MRAEKSGAELVLQPDVINEQTVVAAAITSAEYRREAIRHPPDALLLPQHRPIWVALREAERLKLEPTPGTLARLSHNEVDVAYLGQLLSAMPDAPARSTWEFALAQLLWDRQKYVALTGPMNALLEAMQSGADPEKVRGLGRAVAAAFDGWADRKHMLDPEEVVRSQIADVRERMAGRRMYPYGIPGLDNYLDRPGSPRRIRPGAAPGQVTIVTGSTGAGKSTLTARLCLGLARAGRRVLYGAWEMRGGMTLELISGMSLGYSRTKLQDGKLSEEELAKFEATMRHIGGVPSKTPGRSPAKKPGWVRFMANPFRRTGAKTTNDHNLDIVAGYIADSGCDVFVGDLWERCLATDDPSEEKRALFRMQAICEELNVHGILLAQQRKDVMQRIDKKPTVEGIKGSGAWSEIADTVLGVHRPALWKPVPDDTMEIDILKQRYGSAPLAVEFDWNPDLGKIGEDLKVNPGGGARSIDYEQPMAAGSKNPVDAFMGESGSKGGKKR